jgi:predicted glycogen debranching enzyme
MGGRKVEFGKSDWRTYELGIRKEWLLTNGIGGYASSTIIGANTRRYHGLLVAALKPPVQRHMILSKIDETLEVGGRSYNLYSFASGEYIMKGFNHLQRFVSEPLPTFIYSVEDVHIEKTVCMVYGENSVIVHYNIISGGNGLKLRLTPLINFRDYHHDSRRSHMRFRQKAGADGTIVNPYDLDMDIKLSCSGECFTELDNSWFENMEYAVERERGLPFTEDHFIPGFFDVYLDKNQEKQITFSATIEKDRIYTDGPALIRIETQRLSSLVHQAGYEDEFACRFVAAADNFIVYRKSTDAKTIIAGYPWFTDWGRDTMISLCGLTLVTRRYQDAALILQTFARYIKHGLVPNMFPDEGQEPAYNSVDASLWYFEAVNKFLQYTGNQEFIKNNLYNSLKEIINSFVNGTLFNIRMDADCLVSAGNRETQLTWMDAKIGSWVVTPRHGKAVEINALWYNALCVMEKLAGIFGDDTSNYSGIAGKLKESFSSSFWNYEQNCLFDVINEDYKDGSIRPNQIMAVSLSYPVLDGDMARAVVEKVWSELYTSYGLRSLSSLSKYYRGTYLGDQYMRDGAYHQGTVWAWPMGQFITAFTRVFGKQGKYRKIAASFLKPFKDHLNDACIGSISEIFDGDEPLVPRGCFAQAWSVGEILRAYVEEIM